MVRLSRTTTLIRCTLFVGPFDCPGSRNSTRTTPHCNSFEQCTASPSSTAVPAYVRTASQSINRHNLGTRPRTPSTSTTQQFRRSRYHCCHALPNRGNKPASHTGAPATHPPQLQRNQRGKAGSTCALHTQRGAVRWPGSWCIQQSSRQKRRPLRSHSTSAASAITKCTTQPTTHTRSPITPQTRQRPRQGLSIRHSGGRRHRHRHRVICVRKHHPLSFTHITLHAHPTRLTNTCSRRNTCMTPPHSLSVH